MEPLVRLLSDSCPLDGPPLRFQGVKLVVWEAEAQMIQLTI
ncbi:hypothetical protein [Paenibacillus senegalimassiliensis]|nr:hypothetical protein [Paenibacillus senegalimassiliensis]